MRAERRDPTLPPKRLANPRGEEPVSEAKPYDISKQPVWEAYQRVKANRGAAGVDGVSLARFEQDLKGNLYKVWNRMASGARIIRRPCGSSRYRRTTAARGRSAFRPLPTAWRRRSSRWSWSLWWSRGSIRTPTAIDLAVLRLTKPNAALSISRSPRSSTQLSSSFNRLCNKSESILARGATRHNRRGAYRGRQALYRLRLLRPYRPIVINELNDADHRRVVVRIVLDPRERHDFVKLGDLSDDVGIK